MRAGLGSASGRGARTFLSAAAPEWNVTIDIIRIGERSKLAADRNVRAPTQPASWLASLLVSMSLAFVSICFGQSSDDKQATFFMGRVKYSSNDGNDCSGVGQDLMKLVSRASTLKIQEERKVKLTDADLFETPFLFMNGHNDFIFTEAELTNLRKYLSHGGFFFSSGCCTTPGFPKAWRREFNRIFTNEKVKPIPYDHLIYRSFYKIDRVRCLNEPRDIQLEGLFYQGNLVAVLCEDGLCCAFSAENTCNQGKGISPEDGQKLTLNIAVYALTH